MTRDSRVSLNEVMVLWFRDELDFGLSVIIIGIRDQGLGIRELICVAARRVFLFLVCGNSLLNIDFAK